MNSNDNQYTKFIPVAIAAIGVSAAIYYFTKKDTKTSTKNDVSDDDKKESKITLHEEDGIKDGKLTERAQSEINVLANTVGIDDVFVQKQQQEQKANKAMQDIQTQMKDAQHTFKDESVTQKPQEMSRERPQATERPQKLSMPLHKDTQPTDTETQLSLRTQVSHSHLPALESTQNVNDTHNDDLEQTEPKVPINTDEERRSESASPMSDHTPQDTAHLNDLEQTEPKVPINTDEERRSESASPMSDHTPQDTAHLNETHIDDVIPKAQLKLDVLKKVLSEAAVHKTKTLEALMMFDAQYILTDKGSNYGISDTLSHIPSILMPIRSELSVAFTKVIMMLAKAGEEAIRNGNKSDGNYYGDIKHRIAQYIHKDEDAIDAIDELVFLMNNMPNKLVYDHEYVPMLLLSMSNNKDDIDIHYNKLMSEQRDLQQTIQDENNKEIVDMSKVDTQNKHVIALVDKISEFTAKAYELMIIFNTYKAGSVTTKIIDNTSVEKAIDTFIVNTLKLTQRAYVLYQLVHNNGNPYCSFGELRDSSKLSKYSNIREAAKYKTNAFPYDYMDIRLGGTSGIVSPGLFREVYSNSSDPLNIITNYAVFVRPSKKYWTLTDDNTKARINLQAVSVALSECITLIDGLMKRNPYHAFKYFLQGKSGPALEAAVMQFMRDGILAGKIYALHFHYSTHDPSRISDNMKAIYNEIVSGGLSLSVDSNELKEIQKDFLAKY